MTIQSLVSFPILIRQMTAADLPLCRHLVAEAGWNQLDEDWLRALKLEPEGCFIAEIESLPVATTTTCCFGNVAWIAMVLVDQKMRGRGIAKELVSHAIDYLENCGMATIRLDATAFGQGLYEKLGFKSEYEVIRFAGILGKKHAVIDHVSTLKTSTLVSKIDAGITGTSRVTYLQHLINAAPAPFYYLTKNDKVTGYAGYREGRNAVQIGPVIALDENAGIELLNAITAHFPEKNAYIDIPVQNDPAISWAKSNGFSEQRRFVRMYRGKPVQDVPEMIWASSGPEKG